MNIRLAFAGLTIAGLCAIASADEIYGVITPTEDLTDGFFFYTSDTGVPVTNVQAFGGTIPANQTSQFWFSDTSIVLDHYGFFGVASDSQGDHLVAAFDQAYASTIDQGASFDSVISFSAKYAGYTEANLISDLQAGNYASALDAYTVMEANHPDDLPVYEANEELVGFSGGHSVGNILAVPEPAPLVGLAAGLVAFLRRRKPRWS